MMFINMFRLRASDSDSVSFTWLLSLSVLDFLLLSLTAGEPRTKLLKLPGLLGLLLFPRVRLCRLGSVGLAGLLVLDLAGAGATLPVNRAGEAGGAAVLAKEEGNCGVRLLPPGLLPKLPWGVTLLIRLL